MKHIILLLGVLFLVNGCGKPPESVPSKDALEVESTPFVLETALVRAKAENKLILMKFTGSDWCPPCLELEKTILNTEEFKAYSSTNLIYAKIDFPREKLQTDMVKSNNEALSVKFAIEPFPTLILLGSDGALLWKYEGFVPGITPKDIIAEIDAKKKSVSTAVAPKAAL